MNPAVNCDKNGNGFVRGFVNEDMLADPTIIPHKTVIQTNIAQRLGVHPAALECFLVTSYDDEVDESEERDLNV